MKNFLLDESEYFKIVNLPQLFSVVDWCFKIVYPKYLHEDTYKHNKKLVILPYNIDYFEYLDKQVSLKNDLWDFYSRNISNYDSRIKAINNIKKEKIKYYVYSSCYCICRSSYINSRPYCPTKEISIKDFYERFQEFKKNQLH